MTRFVAIDDMTETVYDELFSINAKGPYVAVQKLAPLMRDGGGVVLTTSESNVKGLPLNSAYAATKAAVRSMARTFARELQPRGFPVNALSPNCGRRYVAALTRSVAPAAAGCAAMPGRRRTATTSGRRPSPVRPGLGSSRRGLR